MKLIIPAIIAATCSVASNASAFTFPNNWTWGTSWDLADDNPQQGSPFDDMRIHNTDHTTEPWNMVSTFVVPPVPVYDGQVVGFYQNVEIQLTITGDGKYHYENFTGVCFFGIITEGEGSIQLGSTTHWSCMPMYTDLLLTADPNKPYQVNQIQYANPFVVNPGDTINFDTFQQLGVGTFPLGKKYLRTQVWDQTTNVITHLDTVIGNINTWEVNGWLVAYGMQTISNSCTDIPATAQITSTIRTVTARTQNAYDSTPPTSAATYNPGTPLGAGEDETLVCNQSTVGWTFPNHGIGPATITFTN